MVARRLGPDPDPDLARTEADMRAEMDDLIDLVEGRGGTDIDPGIELSVMQDQPTWGEVEELHRQLADGDLRSVGEISPTFVAFRGERLLLLAWLRPFPKGGYDDPLTELFALACPWGADRISIAMSARVWSLDDPIPPVSDDVDLRQRALTITSVDAAGQAEGRAITVLVPFAHEVGERPSRAELDRCPPRWSPVIRPPDQPEGWVGAAAEQAVGVDWVPAHLATRTGVWDQLRRCDELGHQLVTSTGGVERLMSLPL